MLLYSGLGVGLQHGPLSGLPLIDPSMGFTDEPGARLAIHQLLRGHLPWWNHFEATGVPLAGDMHSGAFFILSPLVFLANGQAIMNLVTELVTSVGLYLLLRRLAFAEVAAVVASVVYGLNGSYAWLGAVQSYPAAFLPWILYGYERIFVPGPRSRAFGWGWIAVPTALSLTTGFPETAYIDAIFGVAWGSVRLASVPQSRRLPAAVHAALGSLLGVFLVAPLLICFFDYLRVGFIGGHSGAFESAYFPTTALVQTFLPYIWGPIFRFDMPGSVWGSIGGYLGISSVLLVSVALQGSRLRAIRILCFAWAVVTIAGGLGVPVLHWLVVHFPGIRYTAYFRYDPESWELCAAILVGFSLDDLEHRRARRLSITLVGIGAFVVLLGTYSQSWAPTFQALLLNPEYGSWLTFSIAFAAVTFTSVLVGLIALRGSAQVIFLGSVIIAEAAAFLMIPMFANLTAGSIDVRGVSFLQSHLGFERIYSTGPISPNYGTYFGLSELNYNDAPIAARVYDFASELDPYVDSTLFTGTLPSAPGTPTRLATFIDRLDDFESAGVKYLVTSGDDGSEQQIGATTGRPRVLEIGRNTPPIVGTFIAGALAGTIRSVGVFQGNYRNSANGTLSARVCDAYGCTIGRRQLSRSSDNSVFTIPLDRTLRVDGQPVSVTLTDDGSIPDALYLYPGADPRVTLVQGNVMLSNEHLELAFQSSDVPYDDATMPTGNVPYVLTSSNPLRVSVRDPVPAGVVRSIAILIGNYANTADGVFHVTVCSGTTCRAGRRELRGSRDDDFLRVELDRALPISDRQIRFTIETTGAHRAVAIWLYPSYPVARQSIRGSGAPVPADTAVRFRLEYATDRTLTEVYRDSIMAIYRTPDPAPYLSAAGCRLYVETRDEARSQCATRSTLVRLETFMPGWHATVNSRGVPIVEKDPLFQAISLPAGTADIQFSFEPPYERVGFGLLALALALLVADGLLAVVRRRREALG